MSMVLQDKTTIGVGVSSIETWNPATAPADEEFEYIDIASIDRDSKAISSTSRFRAAGAPSRARQIVRANDVLISTVRPNLNAVAVVPPSLDGAIASTGFCVLRCNPKRLNYRYLFHWVRTPQFVAHMVKLATGASYPAVSDRIVKDSEIPPQSPSEQKRIADILDKADDIRRKRRRLETDANSLLRVGFVEICGQPGQTLNSWPVVTLGELLSFVTSGSRGWATYYSKTGKRFIRSLDVQFNEIQAIDLAYVQPPDGQEARRTMVQAGDVLLTITGSKVGRVAPVPADFEEAYVSQHVAILRPNGRALTEYLSMFLSLPDGGQRIIARTQYGQTKPGLSLEQVKQYPVPLPPMDVQSRFRNWWNGYWQHHRRLQKSTLAANELFDSLVQRAFRGEL